MPPSQSLTIGPEFLKSKIARVSLVLTFLLSACTLPALAQNSPNTGPSAIPRIRWIPQPGVRRYRLQIASDERFTDVMYDGVVRGREYIPRDLRPGRYHWRITSAESRNQRFLRFGQFDVRKPSISNAHGPGWVVATGEVLGAITAHLQTGRDLDFLAIDSAGTVYALDSARGTTLWTARYALGAKPASSTVREFEPLVLEGANNTTLVMVRFEKGLRALEGLSGKEVWQLELPEGLVGGMAANLDDVPGSEIYLTDDSTNKLLSLDAQTGRIATEVKLSGRPIGPPVLLNTKTFRGLLVALQGNVIEVQSGDGKHIHSIRLGGDLTTAPVTVETSQGTLMLVGTKDGLIAFETTGFKPLGRTQIDGGHYPAGSLAIVDLDGDKLSDRVLLITNLGRIVAVNLSDLRINWFAEGFSPAATMAFGDLNGDGSLDVVVPDSKNFAVGLSGDSGERIWESPDATKSPAHVKKLAGANLKDGRIIVVGNDPSASGLRAVELRKGLATAAND
jgi:outer membrane protein assembly factor BamB